MTEEGSPKTSEDPMVAKPRKKRKWDQPAEFVLSALPPGVAIPSGIGAVPAMPHPWAGLYPPVPLATVPVSSALPPTIVQSASVPHNAAVAVQKLNQAKVQDEIIAREIVINDAEPSVRCKLTKRQTQDEIQHSTGAVVITRGKYHPPNSLPDVEKPLYLHISAGSHLKDIAERINAVDRAACMVEEILRQGQQIQSTTAPYMAIQSSGQLVRPLSCSIFMGFEVDPSVDIVSRVRGPNGQYINHIMNETGANVILLGKDSGNLDGLHTEVSQQPLHLYITSLHAKSLEAARVLAENLLDTIAADFGCSRTSSSQSYNAVPPPQQLASFQTTVVPPGGNPNLSVAVPSLYGQFAPQQGPPAVPVPIVAAYPPVAALQTGPPLYSGIPTHNANYTIPAVTGGTSYSGYGGIYPQATPLQQVALALRQAPSSTSVISTPASSSSTTTMKTSASSKDESDTDKRPPQKRKFQELPVNKDLAIQNQNSQQVSEFRKSGSESLDASELASVLPSKKPLVLSSMPPRPPSSSTLLLLPPKPITMLPLSPKFMPPPPPKFSQTEGELVVSDNPLKPQSFPVGSSVPPQKFGLPPTPSRTQVQPQHSTACKAAHPERSEPLLKLVDYGEEDDDDKSDDDTGGVKDASSSTQARTKKPFWAV